MGITARLAAKFNSYYADKPGMFAFSAFKDTGSPSDSLNDHDHQRCKRRHHPTRNRQVQKEQN